MTVIFSSHMDMVGSHSHVHDKQKKIKVMELIIKRFKMSPEKEYTVGRLYIDGKYFCDTMEDKDRGLDDSMSLEEIKKIKIHSRTAIPKGTYKVLMTVKSPKFSMKAWYKNLCQGYLPRLYPVKGYEGVLLHVGRTHRDSAGCILIGKNSKVGELTDGYKCFEKLYRILKEAHNKGEAIKLTIK